MKALKRALSANWRGETEQEMADRRLVEAQARARGRQWFRTIVIIHAVGAGIGYLVSLFT